MDSSSSQTEAWWQMRHIQQVAFYSKVKGKSIVAIVITHAIYVIVDLLENSIHYIATDSCVGHGCHMVEITWILNDSAMYARASSQLIISKLFQKWNIIEDFKITCLAILLTS